MTSRTDSPTISQGLGFRLGPQFFFTVQILIQFSSIDGCLGPSTRFQKRGKGAPLMLKDRREPVAPWQCGLKYAPGEWNCGALNEPYPLDLFAVGRWQ